MIKMIYYFPVYILWQILLRLPGENTKNYNKLQPTVKQSLREYIEYELEFSKDPLNRGAGLMWCLIWCLTIIVILIV